MSTLTTICFISLDGVVEDPAWSMDFQSDDTGELNSELLFAADAMLLGRGTWEGFAEAWPSRSGDPFTDRFNAMPKHVVTSTLDDLSKWNNSHAVAFDDVRALRQQQNLLVWGSPTLVQSLLREGLVDEVVLLVSPVTVGAGRRLFADGDAHRLRFGAPTLLSGGMLAVRAEAVAG
jgi:dihydrofolate reductase